jgi:hypothetical protein
MTYREHFEFSFYLSRIFFKGSVCAFLHALFPFVFQKSSTEYAKLLLDEIKSSGCLEKLD